MALQQHKSDKRLTPSTSTPDPARVRDNQRRSRARRKEYLQELEAKLRRYEALGVQASVDIQTAARAVSAENARLREENGRLIEENERLKERLRIESQQQSIVVTGGDNRGCTKAISDSAVTEPEDSGAGNAPEMLSHESLDSSPNAQRQPTQIVAINFEPSVQTLAPSTHTTPTTLQTPPGTHDPIDEDPATHTYHRQSAPESEPSEGHCVRNHESSIGDDTSSCEYAAHIITSMRADISAEDISAHLGCGPNVEEWRKCKVNNAKLFIAMDRYTG